MNELSIQTKQTMSSLEIAKLTGKEHKNVLADIRKILEEAGISTAELSAVYKDQQLIDRPCFNLPFRETNLIISGYSVKHRLAIIDRWQELEAKQNKLPATYIEALEALVQSEKEKEKALLEVSKLNTIVDNEFGYCSIIRAATFLGVHETTFHWRVLKAASLQFGTPPKQVPSPRFGYMLIYPLRAFRECYPHFDFDDLTPELVEDKTLLTVKK